jgi:ABC-type molybdate transport system substrate-binding protein
VPSVNRRVRHRRRAGPRRNSRVVKVTAGGSISAFAEVEVGNPGKAVAKSSGVAVGYALTQGSNNNDAEISLY